MSNRWIPRSAEELEEAAAAGALVETHFQEFKRFGGSDHADVRPQLPGSLAKSLAGLAVDGGMLVLGVSEEKERGSFACVPRPLAGLRDAVDQVALSALSPALRVTVRELVRDDGTGYLVVMVPASPRAPHMVDGSYYGRGDSTSRRLPDIEVRQLWTRHLERRQGGRELLEREIGREPVEAEHRANARLFFVAQPVSADPTLLLDAVPDRDLLAWVQKLNITNLYSRGRQYAPSFASEGSTRRRAHGVARSSSYLESDRTVSIDGGQHPKHSHILDLEYREDGGLRLYYGRASDGRSNDGPGWLLLTAIAGEVAGVIEGARLISQQASFYGSWTLGVALRGIRGIAAYGEHQNFHGGWKFSEDDYDEVVEADSEMMKASGSPLLDALLGRLLRASTGSSDIVTQLDPFPTTGVV